MNILQKFFGHLKTVVVHRHYVMLNCFKAGLIWQGLTHDLSKFSPTEFFESVKYFQGNRSPIDACKEVNGISIAWNHHRGRNMHHYEWWTDYYDTSNNVKINSGLYIHNGIVCHKMPYKYALEMVCDFLGAGKAYMKKKFSYADEYDGFWKNKISKPVAMHEQTKIFVDLIMKRMKDENSNNCLKYYISYEIYKEAELLFENGGYFNE